MEPDFASPRCSLQFVLKLGSLGVNGALLADVMGTVPDWTWEEGWPSQGASLFRYGCECHQGTDASLGPITEPMLV